METHQNIIYLTKFDSEPKSTETYLEFSENFHDKKKWSNTSRLFFLQSMTPLVHRWYAISYLLIPINNADGTLRVTSCFFVENSIIKNTFHIQIITLNVLLYRSRLILYVEKNEQLKSAFQIIINYLEKKNSYPKSTVRSLEICSPFASSTIFKSNV